MDLDGWRRMRVDDWVSGEREGERRNGYVSGELGLRVTLYDRFRGFLFFKFERIKDAVSLSWPSGEERYGKARE